MPLDVYVAAMQHLVSWAEENGLDTRFTKLMTEVFGDACTKCFGDREVAATITILNGSR
ncbi:MAG: hypothetical protein GDA49_08065 [Rhodospirillales bacterium]|nr:hypothetical protein [Rhodospirillales bacterium]